MASTRFERASADSASRADLEALREERDAARDEAARLRAARREQSATTRPRDVLASDWLYRTLVVVAAVAAVLLLVTLLGAIV